MVLVDTSVWVDYLRHKTKELSLLLINGQVYCHPFVVGELSCENLQNRTEILELLTSLQQSVVTEGTEALEFIESNKLYGRGLGWIDVHLLSSALITGIKLWTLDRLLRRVAVEFGLAY